MLMSCARSFKRTTLRTPFPSFFKYGCSVPTVSASSGRAELPILFAMLLHPLPPKREIDQPANQVVHHAQREERQ